MTPVQPILIFLLVAAIVIYFSKLRSHLFDRVIVALAASAGILLVALPNLATTLANAVGVGRGVDLVFYFGLSGLAFLSAILFSKIRELEARLTELVRRLAIREAAPPSTQDDQ